MHSVRYILTAAHCTQNADAKLLTVVIGTIKRFDDGVELNLAEIINHPKYNVFYYDIALLRTAQEIEFSELIKPIALPTYDSMKHGVKVVISGWGYTSVSNPIRWLGNFPNFIWKNNIILVTKQKLYNFILSIPIQWYLRFCNTLKLKCSISRNVPRK